VSDLRKGVLTGGVGRAGALLDHRRRRANGFGLVLLFVGIGS
jgi:hypothetical protein